MYDTGVANSTTKKNSKQTHQKETTYISKKEITSQKPETAVVSTATARKSACDRAMLP